MLNMGAGASTTTNITNSYVLSGNNNGLTSGDQSIGTASSSASTDVSPKTDLNYSQSINPSWTGTLIGTGISAGKKLLGTIGNNTDLIQTVKHVGSTALRIGMEDTTIKMKAKKLVSELLNKTTAQGAITSSEQVPFELLRDAADLQVSCVNKMENAHNAFQTLALGSTGMRNSEVSTQPTNESIIALRDRASPQELQKEKLILEVAGPKLGVIPKGTTTPPNDLAITTFDNAISRYGRLSVVKKQSETITDVQNKIIFSILHNPASLLSQAGVLRPFYLETNLFIGQIQQVSVPFTALSYPNGHLMDPTNLMKTKVNIVDDNLAIKEEFGECALTSYAYKLPYDDNTRDVVLTLSGQIVVVKQPYDPQKPLYIGMLYKSKSGQFKFNRAVLINKDVVMKNFNSNEVPPQADSSALRSQNDVPPSNTNVHLDLDNIVIHDPTSKLKMNYLKQLVNLGIDDSDNLNKLRSSGDEKHYINWGPIKPAERKAADIKISYSYSSQWQVSVNLTDSTSFSLSELIDLESSGWTNMKPIQTVLIAIYPNSLSFSLAVQTPTLSITATKRALEMKLIGTPYYGTIIDLLGQIPNWYTTNDAHDPWNIFRQVIKPLINYSGRIAKLHIESGAPYQLTVDHVTKCMVESGIPVPNEDGMKRHIVELMVGISKWLSTEGPVAKYNQASRKQLFMHICEKVMFQSLTHINVYSEPISELSLRYLEDCNYQNAIEVRMDKARIKAIQ